MGRTEIHEGKVTIAYGREYSAEYFLSVRDTRIWDDWESMSPETNEIALEVAREVGYLFLRTAAVGLGHRVGLETLLEFWKRYGVPDTHIQKARRGEDVEDPKDQLQPCTFCGQLTPRSWPKYGHKYACNNQHAKKAWRKNKSTPEILHKAALANPSSSPSESEYSIKIVKGYLLPVYEDNPRLVDVECEVHPPEDYESGFDYASPSIKEYLGDAFLRPLLIGGPWWGGVRTKPQITVYYRDTFLIEGSPLNACVRNITKGQASHPWSGPMMIMKSPQEDSNRYVDADSEALHAAITELIRYRRKS